MTQPRLCLIGALLSATMSSAVLAQEARVIGWDALLGPTAPIDNPFETLTDDQLQQLGELLRLDVLAKEDGDALAAADGKAMRAQLAQQGLDADALFEARLRLIDQLEREARVPNADIVGDQVRLPGYLLPIEMVGEKTTEFLLVPTVGACVHVPPPPANQIVRVSYPEGFPADGFFTPIWITGTITDDPVLQSLYLVDGDTDVEVTYHMHADYVTLYEF